MKRKNIRNNVENKIRSILLDDGHFLFKVKKKSTLSTWSYFALKSNKGITLIALIITIILMLILAGIVLSLALGENGMFNTAKYAVVKTEEEKAREKLELALADLTAHKYTNIEYDENKYINDYLIKEGMTVEGDIVLVDGWRFTIDRTVPKIGENLGQGEIKAVSITIPYIGTTSFTAEISYVYDEEEIQEYVYIIDNKEITSLNKEYTTLQELEPESTHTVQVIAKYKDGTQLESNKVTIKTEPRTYLYNNGDECINTSGGWKAIAVGDGYVDENGATGYNELHAPEIIHNAKLGYMRVQLSTPASSHGYRYGGSFTINKKIDYSEYKSINVIYTASLSEYENDLGIDILKNYETPSYDENYLDGLCWEKEIDTKTKCTLDISQDNNFNSFYIYLQSHQDTTASINIYEVWLEK